MSLEIVAGLLGSQLVRAVACEIATTLLCKGIQQAAISVAKPRTDAHAHANDAVTPTASPAVGGRSSDGEAVLPELRVLPSVEIVSAVAGRVRLRVHGLRDDGDRAAELEATMQALPGVTSAKANARTGTLLVHFDQTEASLGGIVSTLEPPVSARRPRAAERASHLRLVVG